jgi:hypothetical protein
VVNKEETLNKRKKKLTNDAREVAKVSSEMDNEDQTVKEESYTHLGIISPTYASDATSEHTKVGIPLIHRATAPDKATSWTPLDDETSPIPHINYDNDETSPIAYMNYDDDETSPRDRTPLNDETTSIPYMNYDEDKTDSIPYINYHDDASPIQYINYDDNETSPIPYISYDNETTAIPKDDIPLDAETTFIPIDEYSTVNGKVTTPCPPSLNWTYHQSGLLGQILHLVQVGKQIIDTGCHTTRCLSLAFSENVLNTIILIFQTFFKPFFQNGCLNCKDQTKALGDWESADLEGAVIILAKKKRKIVESVPEQRLDDGTPVDETTPPNETTPPDDQKPKIIKSIKTYLYVTHPKETTLLDHVTPIYDTTSPDRHDHHHHHEHHHHYHHHDDDDTLGHPQAKDKGFYVETRFDLPRREAQSKKPQGKSN